MISCINLLFLAAIIITSLWLTTKYLGRTGLFAIITTFFIICQTNLGDIACKFLSANIFLDSMFILATIFAVWLLYKEYGLGDTIKGIIVAIMSYLIYALSIFIIWIIEGVSFGRALEVSLVPFLISLFSIICIVVVAYVFIKVIKWNDKTSPILKELCILGVVMFANSFVYILLSQAGDVAFGQILINILMTFVIELIFIGILVLLEKYLFKIKPESNFGNVIAQKITNATTKVLKLSDADKEAKASKKPEVKPEEPDDDENDDEEEVDEKTESIKEKDKQTKEEKDKE